MFRARSLARSFSILDYKNSASLLDSYMSSIPGPGLSPAAEYAALPKVGMLSGVYEATRDLAIDIITAVNDMGYGMGVGIICISVGFRIIYSPILLWSQIIGLKLKMIQPEMNKHRSDMQQVYQTGNRKQLAVLNANFSRLKKSFGIRQDAQLYSLTQIPFLISFFFTLQEIAYSPDIYPGMLTDGFLWFQNLTEPDPYYILPIAFSVCNFLNILKSPTTSGAAGQWARYAKFMKYFTLLTIPVSGLMPAAIVLNWFIMSFFQLICSSLVYTKTGRKLLTIPEILPGSHTDKIAKKAAATQIIKPVIYSQKPTNK
ncbi:OXA1_2 [Blepharisma stoltei]|uniref:Membrane insertase YidC/Oxa/ALB C-terminal domain-containing protein n=1 Tax=Blepharisma stoltei TaxID=1481888 RepID=A0AAU9IVA4_9CILI|nr:unnamed protein product [Blepharisma stoltei]